MRTLIYWVLAVSSLFLVSCSKDSNVLNDYHRDTVLENMVYRFGGTGDETIYDIIKVDDGIVIVGTTNSVDGDFEGINFGETRYGDWVNAFIMKINLEKELEWLKVYGTTEERSYDSFYQVFENEEGYTVLGGSNSLSGDFEGYSIFKTELDSRGYLVSVSAFPAEIGYLLNRLGLYFIDKVDGCCYLTLTIYDNVILRYLNENFDVSFSRTYEGASWGWSEPSVFGISLSDGYLIAGNTQSNEGIFEGLNPDLLGSQSMNVFLMKTDDHGEIEWLRTYGGRENDELIALLKGNNNSYIVAGNNQTNDGDFEGYGGEFQRDINQIFMISVNAAGETEWIKTYGGSEDEHLENLIGTPDGGYLLSGRSLSHDGDFINSGTGFNFLMKVGQAGDKEWVKKFTIPKVNNTGIYSEPIKAVFSIQDSYLIAFEASEGKQIVLTEVNQSGDFVE